MQSFYLWICVYAIEKHRPKHIILTFLLKIGPITLVRLFIGFIICELIISVCDVSIAYNEECL
jgi:hypothetical protein